MNFNMILIIVFLFFVFFILGYFTGRIKNRKIKDMYIPDEKALKELEK